MDPDGPALAERLERQDRPPEEVFLLAERLQDFSPDDRSALDQALRIMAEAAAAVRGSETVDSSGLDLAPKEKAVLEAARRIHGAIVNSVMDLVRERLDTPYLGGETKTAPDQKRRS